MEVNRYRNIRVAIAWLLTTLVSLYASAQTYDGVRVIPELDKATIRIGEQVNLNIRVVYPRSQVMQLALPQDTLVTGVEIIESNLIDSTIINNELQEMIYKVTLTSFDSATYQLSNINALVGDSLFTAKDQISLIVNTVPVDLEHPEEYADIKGQWKPDFVWQDYLIYLYIFIGILLLGLIIWLLIKRLRKRKGTSEAIQQIELVTDPYQEAMQSIKDLKSKELWEHNQTKEYYTQLTDILRRYLWRVYGIDTQEKTSSEILNTFEARIGKQRMYSELMKILRTADLAKFAKYQPSSSDNISLLNACIAFIEEHKPQEEKTEEKGGEEQ